MHPWIGPLILYGLPILLILSGIWGMLTGILPFGDESTHGWKARILGVAFIAMGLFFAYILRILATGQY